MRGITCIDGKLSLEKLPDPTPKTGEILVEVAAIGVNRADLLQRKGKYPPPPGASPLLGLEVAGTVAQTGETVSHFQEGDRVMCLLAGGGYAEKVTVDASLAMPIPSNLSFEEAAAIPEAFLTGYQALFQIGELTPGQWVLIHAAGSGVGTAAIQLASEGGARSIGTTRSRDKLEKCLALGAEGMVHPKEGKFANQVAEVTENHGADLILDFVGASYFDENFQALAQGGAILCISTLGGHIQEKFDLRLLMKKWGTLSGTTLRSRPLTYKAKLVEEFSHFALDRFEKKKLRPIISDSFPWEEVEKAHSLLEKGEAFGKVVLRTSQIPSSLL